MADEICAEWLEKEARERGKKNKGEQGIHKEYKGHKNKGRSPFLVKGKVG